LGGCNGTACIMACGHGGVARGSEGYRVVFELRPLGWTGSRGGRRAVGGGVRVVRLERPSGPGSAPPYRSFEGLYVPCLLAVALIAAGLVALHAHLRGTYGGLGTAGFLLAMVGAAVLVLVVGGAPFLLSRVGALGLLLGSALMGAAALRASARLRWRARRWSSARWRSSCSTPRARGRGSRCRTGELG
jgi:hypothetical protein